MNDCEYYNTCRNRKEFAEREVCYYCLEVKSLDGKIHTLEQGLFFESATVATAAKEALLEMDNGNLHDVRIILKTLAGE